MQIGDTIRVRFLTMPEPFPGAGATKDNLYPVRKATVVYVGVCASKGALYRGGVQGRAGDVFPGGGADMSEFPERLRKLREKKRLKRYVLSERCGLNSDAIRRYELGTAKPTMDALKSIADEFGVSVDYLMGRTDYPCVVDIAEK